MSAVGDTLANAQAQNRRAAGSPVTVGGVSTWAITASLTATQAGEYLPDGTRNAANADPRIFNVTPTDFTTPPQEGTRLTWAFGGPYTVLRVLLEIYGGAAISYRLVCYRTPVEGTSTQDAAQLNKWPYTPPT